MNDEGRELPVFDNHYSNQTLVDTWWESRWCHNSHTGARLPISLTGATEVQQQQDVLRWGPRQHTTYQDHFGRKGWSIPTATTAMIRPHGLQKELLLSTGENMYIRGPPTSWDYGAEFRPPSQDDGLCEEGKRPKEESLLPSITPLMGKKGQLLYAATASARSQCLLEDAIRSTSAGAVALRNRGGEDYRNTLYDSLHNFIKPSAHSRFPRPPPRVPLHDTKKSNSLMDRFPTGAISTFPRTLTDTTGAKRQLNVITAEALPDYCRWSQFTTTRKVGDLPVEHFSFQKNLPPPSIPRGKGLTKGE